MFVKAIESADLFTKPIHTITRTYGGILTPGTSTLFFVNDEGVAITCKHVINLILQSDEINVRFQNFKAESDKIPRDAKFRRNLAGLELKYKYKKESTIQIKNQFLNAVDQFTSIDCIAHPTIDLAILKFRGFNTIHYQSHATFVKDPEKIKQGRYLCRLGYPFPEFNNYQHNPATDDIEWTNTGNPNSPRFPLDGIITRFGGDGNQIVSIEMSTPGLRGQSGGPLFDTDGLVYGMQFMTSHLHLGFDIHEKELIHEGKKIKVSNFPFLHVGHCIHVDRIKEFLTLHQVRFYEEA
ncbi:MAG TPA: trypsin-like peptidase domain-containing protein [Bacteroidales bacterium]|nr:trypsin-like peptidase domain-containing protein [Bacteroidales bacterium]